MESERIPMVTGDFSNFFMAGTGAGAALIGLLFVAISIRPSLVASHDTHPVIQITIAMAFTALVNGFFIAFVALLPGVVIGDVALVMGTFSSWSCLSAAIGLIRQARPLAEERDIALARQLARGLVLVVVGAFIYGWEIVAGWQAVQTPKETGPVWTIANLVIATFGLGLVRAWELLGARRGSGLLRWLSPLGEQDADESPPPHLADEARSLAGGADAPTTSDDGAERRQRS